MSEIGSISKVAKGLDLTKSALPYWVAQAQVDQDEVKDGYLTTGEREELRRLRRETKILDQEQGFLRIAGAFFARDQDPRTR